MATIPAMQYASGAVTTYQRVKALKKANQTDESITFKWSSIDNITAGELKDAIAKVASNHNSPSNVEDPKVAEFLKDLFKNNMTQSVTIDYKKLNGLSLEGSFYASTLRSEIQNVLEKNTGRLYTSMTMNPVL